MGRVIFGWLVLSTFNKKKILVKEEATKFVEEAMYSNYTNKSKLKKHPS